MSSRTIGDIFADADREGRIKWALPEGDARNAVIRGLSHADWGVFCDTFDSDRSFRVLGVSVKFGAIKGDLGAVDITARVELRAVAS